MGPVASAPGVARGYACIIVANLVFAIGFSFVAAIGGAMTVWQLVLVRGVVFGLVLMPWAVRHGKLASGSSRGLLLLRGGLGTVMVLCLLSAIAVLPLSVATLLGKTTPLWELLMLWLLLALRPHLSDVLLVPVAILGLVLILHPEGHLNLLGLGSVALLLALGAGMLNSLEFITLRRLRGTDQPHTINLWYTGSWSWRRCPSPCCSPGRATRGSGCSPACSASAAWPASRCWRTACTALRRPSRAWQRCSFQSSRP
jgi:drug/metabolite transporter (DMT)-like permease